MAKFFRVIVNLCIICFLLTGIALIVPQFLGISTVVVDGQVESNLSAGSVVYGKSVAVGELEVGDKLLQSDSDSVYVRKITAADAGTGTYTVDGGDGSEEVTLRNKAEKAIVTIPVIGYVNIAMQTFEGRIILGLALVFLIILFILSEIWKNSREADEEDEEEHAQEPPAESRRERRRREKEEKRRRKEEERAEEESPFMLSGEEPEDEAEFAPDAEAEEVRELVLENAEYEEPAEQRAPETGAEEDEDDAFAASIQAALENQLDNPGSSAQVRTPEETVPEEEVREAAPEKRELAMPVLTAEEILEKAYADGDQPKVIEDEEDGVTLVDYSDIL